MSSPKFPMRLASILFGLMSLGQLWRLVTRPDLLVDGAQMPLWPSAIAFALLAGLSLWYWCLSSKWGNHGSDCNSRKDADDL